MRRRWIARFVLLLLVAGIQIPVRAATPLHQPPTVTVAAPVPTPERTPPPQPVKGSKTPSSAGTAPASGTVAPITAEPAAISKSDTLAIRFFWGSCGKLTRDESVVMTVTDIAQPDIPVTTWVYGSDITIDEAASEYRQSFRPATYGIASGTILAVDLFLHGQHAGHSLIRVGP